MGSDGVVRTVTKQIVAAAPGWMALWTTPNVPGYLLGAVACWALVIEGDGEEAVVGMVGGEYLQNPEEDANFGCYVHEGDLTKGFLSAYTVGVSDAWE